MLMRHYPFLNADPGVTGTGTSVVPPAANPLLTMPDDLIPDNWKDHVRDLRKENATWKQRAEENFGTTKRAVDEAKATAEAEKAEFSKAADERVLRSELKAAALKAGMVDLDGLKLADLSKVKLSADGEVEGADALMESLKTAKPYLFSAATTSSTVTAPKPTPSTKPLATQMTPVEYAKARADIRAGRLPTV